MVGVVVNSSSHIIVALSTQLLTTGNTNQPSGPDMPLALELEDEVEFVFRFIHHIFRWIFTLSQAGLVLAAWKVRIIENRHKADWLLHISWTPDLHSLQSLQDSHFFQQDLAASREGAVMVKPMQNRERWTSLLLCWPLLSSPHPARQARGEGRGKQIT